MSEIIKIFLFVYIIIKTSCDSNLTLTTDFNISDPKIKINNQDFSMRMDIPMIIFKKQCFSNESKTIEWNGENKVIHFCKENMATQEEEIKNVQENLVEVAEEPKFEPEPEPEPEKETIIEEEYKEKFVMSVSKVKEEMENGEA